MTKNQFRLNEIARTLDVDYHWLSYRVSTGKTPVRKKIAYSSRDVDLLREWVCGRRPQKVDSQRVSGDGCPDVGSA